jgi:hypothetical protein
MSREDTDFSTLKKLINKKFDEEIEKYNTENGLKTISIPISRSGCDYLWHIIEVLENRIKELEKDKKELKKAWCKDAVLITKVRIDEIKRLLESLK